MENLEKTTDLYLKQGFDFLGIGLIIPVSLFIAIWLGLSGCDSNAEVKNMIKNECSIEYDSSINAFIVKILGKITQQDIYVCQKIFEKAIAEHCKNKKYNILLYMDHDSHTLENVKLIRLLTSTPKVQNSIIASAAVFTNSPNPGINGNEGNFSNTKDAVEFLKRKNIELLKANK